MARPQTLSRSTKVLAKGDRRNKKKGKNKNKPRKGRSKEVLKWDHDDTSSSDGEPESNSGRAPAGKKRPRQNGEEIEAVAGGAVIKTKQTFERQLRADGEVGSAHGCDLEPTSESGGEDDDDKAENQERMAGGQPAAAATKGGMGDVMAKILGQRLNSKTQAPLLAKRKTKAMKELEEEAVNRAENRGKSAARKAQLTQQFVVPDHTTADYERQLKKIATRGVVSLFNAISKRQSQSQVGDGVGSDGKGVTGAAKAASRHAFLNMLKTGVKPDPPTGTNGRGSEKRKGGKDGGIEEEGARSWSVLKEDYMMGASSMKNWDQESAESEPDVLGGVDAMSDDGSD